jgi:phage terminase large subunit-like protein
MSNEISEADKFALLPKEDRDTIIESFSGEQLKELLQNWEWWARPKQLRCFENDWNTFIYLCGRGFGKSRTACEWVRRKALDNPGCKIAVVGATAGIVNRTVVKGDGGIMDVCRSGEAVYRRGDAEIRFENGSVVFLYSADEPKRLRGPNHHFALADDIIAWRYPEAYHMLKLTLRIGINPQMLITTSAGATPLILDIVSNGAYTDGDEEVVENVVEKINAHEFYQDNKMIIVRGTTFENTILPVVTLEDYKTSYPPKSIMGQQELYARIVLKVEGALFDRKWLQTYKTFDKETGEKIREPEYARTILAVDPAVSANKNSDYTAITVASKGVDGKYYVRYSKRFKHTPGQWAAEVIRVYKKYNADKIVAEKNNGGDMVEYTLRQQNSFVEDGIRYDITPEDLPIELIHAKAGKFLRATPIAYLYENLRVWHVGIFSELEQQMCTFKGEPNGSDDLVDSMVYALLDLSGARIVDPQKPKVGGTRTTLNLADQLI